MLLCLAWAYGGEDPYRLLHGLGPDYAPLAGGPPLPPRRPRRVRSFVYACGAWAHEHRGA